MSGVAREMMGRLRAVELLVLSTAIGLVAKFAAPWLELRGVFQAWSLVEWHTFWRGAEAFLLADVVAPGYPIPIEFATRSMEQMVQIAYDAGVLLGVWHLIVLAALLTSGARLRQKSGISRKRVALEVAVVIMVNALVVYALVILLALPSNIYLNVDFRTPQDLHASGLVWSGVTLMPLAPALALVSIAGEVIGARMLLIKARDVTKTKVAHA